MKLEYQLKLTNVPENIIITSPIPKEVTATISGRGYDMLDYVIKNQVRLIEVDFQELLRNDFMLTIDNNLWKRLLMKQIGSTFQQVATAPPTLQLYYSSGLRKRVPITYSGECQTGSQYSLCDIKILPDSVEVYAPAHIYDSIKVVQTEERNYSDIKRTFTERIAINPGLGIKTVPDSVDVQFRIDLFTEKTVSVPILCENTPKNKIVRTFPLSTKLTFRVSASEFNNITEDDFLVTIDYNNINISSNSCKLILSKAPSAASHIRLSPETVEYVIEKNSQAW